MYNEGSILCWYIVICLELFCVQLEKTGVNLISLYSIGAVFAGDTSQYTVN